MPPLKPHRHNGTDSHKLSFREAIERAPQPAVDEVAGTAGGSYGVTEQNIINDTKDSLNDLIQKLQLLGIIE